MAHSLLTGVFRCAVSTVPRRHLRFASAVSRPYDVVIVGGGVIGSSVAFHLTSAASAIGKAPPRIAVVERDNTYAKASAPLSAGGIRQQFSLAENVQLSMYGVEFLKRILPEQCRSKGIEGDVQFRENGYLFLASSAGEEAMRENWEVQKSVGADWISLLTADELKTRFPWLNTDGVVLGAFGEHSEGYFDPWAMLQAMRKYACSEGVTYIEQDVTDISCSASTGEVTGVHLADGDTLEAPLVVNAAGAFGGRIVEMCGDIARPIPVVPRKRCIFSIQTDCERHPELNMPCPPGNTPLTVDPLGVYFRSDTCPRHYITGVSPDPENDKDATLEDLDTVDCSLYDDVIWPALAERVPAFEALKVGACWAGFYEYNTFDQNGIVGWHPDVPNMLLACGFSGHGLQQAPGVGRACAELIEHGSYRTLDLARFSCDRIYRGEPLLERGIV
eukprot:TRINITY_DN323_c0_g1_i1.p1 TRINITY_DN323_c0_g1~~TRINITY_DN323_c0_g1_i1.p1  ORF type:complete len:446 (-),score=33.00 TRINITY_DN323_c0_g1_i1:114-1451(-)